MLLCPPFGYPGISKDAEIACMPLPLIFVSPNQINFYLPEAPPKKTWPQRSGHKQGNSRESEWHRQCSKEETFGAVHPRIFPMGYDCLTDTRSSDANHTCGLTLIKPSTVAATRGAVTDQQGRLLTSANRARLFRWLLYTLDDGLGVVSTAIGKSSVYVDFTEVPVYGYGNTTNLFFAPVLYVGTSTQFPGLYQVNFQLPSTLVTGGPGLNPYPPAWPCGDRDWEISIDVLQGSGLFNATHANLVQIPVTIKQGDAPCSQP